MKAKGFLYESFHRPRRFVHNLIDHPAIILLYHRVTALDRDPQLLAVKPENFYRQVEFLKKNYTVLRVDEFAHLLTHHKKFPPRSVLITFDDGYADNVLQACPILESLNIQALFYVTTSLLGTNRELWWDDLERILLEPEKLPDFLSLTIEGNSLRLLTDSVNSRMAAYQNLQPRIKYLLPERRQTVFSQLLTWASLGEEGRATHRMMTVDEVRLMSKSTSAVIGAHTHSHTPLSVLSYEEQKKEIAQSVKTLQDLTGNNIDHFSYPFGLKKDYNSETLNIVEELRFIFVCANYYDHVHRNSPRYELPRILIRDWDFNIFRSSMNKFFRY